MKVQWRQFVVWLTKLYVWYFVKADRKEKCPSCGIRQLHPMRYDQESKKILHMCKTSYVPDAVVVGCGAVWATDTLREPSQWEVLMKVIDGSGNEVVEQPDVEASRYVKVTREPIVIKAEPKEKKTA